MKNYRPFIEPDSISTGKSFQHTFKLVLSTVLLVLCIFFSVIKVSAQEVRELNSALSVNNSETGRLTSLVRELQPTLYFQQSKIVGNEEDEPVLIDTDVASVNLLYEKNSAYSSVEIIRVRVNNPADLKLILDISRLGEFTNLKYIYFLCTFDICGDQVSKSSCETGKILKMIRQSDSSNVSFFYLISIPS